MQIQAGSVTDLPREVLTELARYRHKVFVERLGWGLPTREGLELDQFDRADTIYVAARNDGGDVIGVARLLPTTGPYLLSELFPQLLGGAPLPSSQKVWELSRFAAVDLSKKRESAWAHFSSPVAVALLRAAIRVAADRGAERLITVSPVGVARLLRNAAFRAQPVAPPIVVGGDPLFACLIECMPAPAMGIESGDVRSRVTSRTKNLSGKERPHIERL